MNNKTQNTEQKTENTEESTRNSEQVESEKDSEQAIVEYLQRASRGERWTPGWPGTGSDRAY